MSRRFYLKIRSPHIRPASRAKASYPLWFIPLFAGVGALLAVLLFWTIRGSGDESAWNISDRNVKNPAVAVKDSETGAPAPQTQPMSARPEPAVTTPSVSLNGVRVQVLNGCGVKGLARRMSPALRGLGLDVRETKNAPHSEYVQSSIIDRRGRMEVARALADSLGISRSQVSSELNPNLPDIDVSLIVGKDYRRLNLIHQRSTGE